MSSTNQHFDRRNAFVDQGWPGRLSKLQLAVWLVYDRHADESGEAWPGSQRIAHAIGHAHINHIRQIRSELCEMGLLALVKPGGGADTARYRVLCPDNPAQNRCGVPRPESVHGLNQTPPRIGAETPPRIGAIPRPDSVHQRDNEGIREGNTTAACAAVGPVNGKPHRTGKPGRKAKAPNPDLPRLILYFCEGYRAKFNQKYPFTKGKDNAAAVAILAGCENNLSKAKAAVDAFLASDDPFIAQAGHTLSILRMKLAAFLEKTSDASAFGEPRTPSLEELADWHQIPVDEMLRRRAAEPAKWDGIHTEAELAESAGSR